MDAPTPMTLSSQIAKHFKTMQQRPVMRTKYASMYFTQQHENPWASIHNGTVRDAISLAEWELCIPTYGCACRKDYMLYKASTPPDFTSAESLWLWGVNLHNHVNRKLGKSELTVDEARLQWSRSDDLEHQQG